MLKIVKKNEELEHEYRYHINHAKWLIKNPPICRIHCPKSCKCKKLSGYMEKLKSLEEAIVIGLDTNVEDARQKLVYLKRKALGLRNAVERCAYVRKNLSRKGYRTWFPPPKRYVHSIQEDK